MVGGPSPLSLEEHPIDLDAPSLRLLEQGEDVWRRPGRPTPLQSSQGPAKVQDTLYVVYHTRSLKYPWPTPPSPRCTPATPWLSRPHQHIVPAPESEPEPSKGWELPRPLSKEQTGSGPENPPGGLSLQMLQEFVSQILRDKGVTTEERTPPGGAQQSYIFPGWGYKIHTEKANHPT